MGDFLFFFFQMFLLYNIANIGVKKVATQDVIPEMPLSVI